jgi:hypothetical protein
VRDDGTAVIGERRIGRTLRIVGLIAVSLWFWATVVLVQLPWLALMRRTQPTKSMAPQQLRERERKELELRLSASEGRARLTATIKGDNIRAVSMGGMPHHERHRIVREIRDRQQRSKKTGR